MKKLLSLTAIAAVLLLSGCDFLFGPEPSSTTKKFWAQDTNKAYSHPSYFYQIDAELLAENDRCKVWAETASGVSKAAAQRMADAYRDIYTKMLSVFGFTFSVVENGKTNFYNALQYADVDGDGKLCILLLDIKDDYQKGVNETSVSGYFNSDDLFRGKYSNLCDIVYIDTNPGKPEEWNMTLAHELQHLMNEVTSIAVRRVDKSYYKMDLWINEGLSGAAEWLYLRDHPVYENQMPYYHPRTRWGWYYRNGDGRTITSLIDKGNNFFVWDNHKNENKYAILDDYATVYLFFQWLRIQSDTKEGIYKDIISSEYWDYQAVTTAAGERIHDVYYDWIALIRDWLAANYINAYTGFLGYENDPELRWIKGHLLSTTNESVTLYPGEGVYSFIDESYAGSHSMPANESSSPNIFYYVLTDRTEFEMQPGALLTFNANPYNYILDGSVYKDPLPETGTVTGLVNQNPAASVQGGRSAAFPGLTGPYRIGAADVRRE